MYIFIYLLAEGKRSEWVKNVMISRNPRGGTVTTPLFWLISWRGDCKPFIFFMTIVTTYNYT